MQFRFRRALAAVISVATIGSFLASSNTSASPAPVPAAPAGTAERVGPPRSMVVLGDSISKATGSDGAGAASGGTGVERPLNSWATGTQSGLLSNYQRILALPGGAGATALNLAANGANMKNNFLAQAQSVPEGTQYVMVEMGGNDLCRPTEAEMTTEADYRAQFRAGLDWLKANRPEAIVFAASIPDIYNLWYIRGAAHQGEVFGAFFGFGGTAVPGPRAARSPLENTNKGNARFFWDGLFGSLIPCRSLLVDPSNPRNVGPTPDASNGAEARRLRVRARTIAFNSILQQECGAMLRCRFDNNALFNFSSNRNAAGGLRADKTTWAFQDIHISVQDHFHPSFAGQQKVAENTFQNSYNFTDVTAPAVTLSANPAMNGNGWNNGNVVFTMSATDAAGVRGLEYRTVSSAGTSAWTQVLAPSVAVTVSAADITHVEARALDINGNMSASSLRTVAIDRTAPQVALVTPAQGGQYEQHAAIDASFTCSDAAGGSDIDSCTGTVGDRANIDTSSVGTKTFSVTATDGAGNQTTVTRTYEVIDVTAPTIDLRTPADGEPFDRRAETTADYDCADEAGGSGLASCVGTVSDGDLIDTATVGDKQFTVAAADNAGNTDSVTHIYTVVDVTAPTVTLSTPVDGGTYDHHQVVNAAFSCEDDDGGSGIAAGYCVGTVVNGSPIDTTTLGAHTFTVTATDRQGNESEVTHSYVVVDVTAPTVASAQSGGSFELQAVVPASFTCTDETGGSGVATCTGPANLNTSSVGPKSYNVSTTDTAGNSRTVAISYRVVYANAVVQQPINADGSSIFKQGSTVPVKFRLTDAAGAAVGTATGTVSYVEGSAEVIPSQQVIEAVSTSAASISNQFRWDATAQQYIFNLGTKTMRAGPYTIVIDLDDGTRYTAVITLR